MKTGKLWIASMLSATILTGCTSMEEPAAGGSADQIRINADIAGTTTRAVINGSYADDLDISFARMDNPSATGSAWNTPSIDAVRTGGTGNQAITFAPVQTYLISNEQSALIGYYPRKELNGASNLASVSYTITGNEDIMATEIKTGSLNAPFTAFTFRHLLTQLQFKCVGSAQAATEWTAITSITVKDVATGLKLSLNKTGGATLTATGTADRTLTVKNCPAAVSVIGTQNPQTGYLMLYPAEDMGTTSVPIKLEIQAMYSGASKILQVEVKNIDGGIQKGQSHLITLTFTEDGKIAAEAGIAEWQPGNGGSSVVIPPVE